MRGQLRLTVAATVSIVLLAMLVPMAVLVRDYALEDRIVQAALEVQATETVVSGAGEDRGEVSVYVERINDGSPTTTTVYFPDGDAVGPDAEADDRVEEARETGQARIDDTSDGGARILVPVSLGRSSEASIPVIQVDVAQPGLGSGVLRAYLVLALLGILLLAGAIVLAERLGRTFTTPIRALAGWTQQLGERTRPDPVPVGGPSEVQDLGSALGRLVGRIEQLLDRERESVADLSHRLRTPVTALRLRIDQVEDPVARLRLTQDLEDLEHALDSVVREARRSQREGIVAQTDARAVVEERAAFWGALAEDQARDFTVDLPRHRVPVASGHEDLAAILDVLLDNAFSYTDEGAALRVTLGAPDGGGALVVVEDSGPGFPDGLDVAGRGESGSGSTGLGLSIVARTAEASGGDVELGSSDLGGARIAVRLGPPH
ncbi:HAMP domain-containing sensor histidine kinase [uncultured Nocardioides sp.]|uniref:sensor histidine kinase n=1 Tax=uncultured Nocardioides sp. TaxID=198441 RepID=UPI002622B742|nr:HAMP domain-containing sensor histidine kinase [uncultured Nocardioides sp.]